MWLGCKSKGGYGNLRRNKVYTTAHRVSYELHVGPIPDGMFVCHTCDVKHCVNPDHLFLGTPYDNMADKMMKGRGIAPPIHRGERHRLAKLKCSDIPVIRKMVDNGVSRAQVARDYDVSWPTIDRITHGDGWSHI